MARIKGVDPDQVERQIKTVFDAQAQAWGNPLLNHLVYARRPTIFRGARAMWTGIEASQLIPPALRALVNRRVASLNGCEF
jgi:alkylhydroperoxidase family enzyme